MFLIYKCYCNCVGAFSLSMKDWTDGKGETSKHYKIRNLDNGGYYITTRRTFMTLPDLIEHYKGLMLFCVSSQCFKFEDG